MIFPPPATPSFLSGCSCVLDRQGGWLAAPTLSLPASCSPYRAMHSLWRELVSLPTSGELAPPPANQSSEVQVRTGSQHCCFARSASEGKDTPAFKQHGTSSVRRPTLHRWHLSPGSSAFTLGKIHALTLKVFQQHAFFLH